MSKKHIFTTAYQNFALSEMTVLAVYAIVNLNSNEANAKITANPKIMAIKQLRSVTGMGLLEAKRIVDFIADHAAIRDNGEISIEIKLPVVSYTVEE